MKLSSRRQPTLHSLAASCIHSTALTSLCRRTVLYQCIKAAGHSTRCCHGVCRITDEWGIKLWCSRMLQACPEACQHSQTAHNSTHSSGAPYVVDTGMQGCDSTGSIMDCTSHIQLQMHVCKNKVVACRETQYKQSGVKR